MKTNLIKFWPFALIITFFVVVSLVYVFKPRSDIEFKPVEMRTIDEDASNLSPAADIKGNWTGTAVFKNADNPDHYCTYSGELTLKITAQKDNHMSGKFTYGASGNTPHDAQCENWAAETYKTEGTVSGSRIVQLSVPNFGTFSGSLTSDTITLRQDALGAYNLQMTGSANLLRR